MHLPIDRDAVLAAFRETPDRPLKAREVGRFLDVGPERRAALRAMLHVLVDEGDLEALPGRRFALPGGGPLLEGRVKLHRGFGWFLPEGAGRRDAYLPGDEVAGLTDGDLVRARIGQAPKGPVASVVKVLARGRKLVTGTLRRAGNAAWVEAPADVIASPVLLAEGEEGGADGVEDGMVVEALLLHYPTKITSAVGRVVRVLGAAGELSVEVERILAESDIPRVFAPEALAEAAGYGPLPSEEDMRGREDLRALSLCTIDGETAKDFDDAVAARQDGNDIVVTVAIADVSHYVREGTALDEEAQRRGTSVYYPGAVVPMLPETLSNGLCSLNPHVDRLCMVVELRLQPNGRVKRTRFFEGVMKSHARLTYTLVARFLDGDPAARAEIPADVQESLSLLAEVAARLRRARMARGAMDFDLPESVIKLDDEGVPINIHPQERNDAHKLIEELMLAANEAVAQRFFSREAPCIYRVHEPPDVEKLENFFSLARLLAPPSAKRPAKGRKGTAAPSPKELGELLRSVEESPLSQPLSYLLLRAMMQARYSADNVGHYSLASDAYLHFTSPIRRYPDLIVHRLLRAQLRHARRRTDEVDKERQHLRLEEIAEASSQAERRATDVERSMYALFQAWFMRDKVGEVHAGVVSGCAEFGVFVRLHLHHVEGLAHVSTISGEFLEFDDVRLRLYSPRSGFSVGVGDEVEVEVTGADIGKRQITFKLKTITKQQGRVVSIIPSDREAERWERRAAFEERRAAWEGPRAGRSGRGEPERRPQGAGGRKAPAGGRGKKGPPRGSRRR